MNCYLSLLSMDEKELLIKIGQNIKRIREAKGISLEELALQCKQETSTIQAIEDGEADAGSYLLYEIAFALEVEMKEIVI